jgi:hypothetical protein
MGTGSFPEVKEPGRGVDHPLPSSVKVKGKSRLIPLLPLWVFMVCCRVNFTFTVSDQDVTPAVRYKYWHLS